MVPVCRRLLGVLGDLLGAERETHRYTHADQCVHPLAFFVSCCFRSYSLVHSSHCIFFWSASLFSFSYKVLSLFLSLPLATFLPASPSPPAPTLGFTLHIFTQVLAASFGPVWLGGDLLRPAESTESSRRGLSWQGGRVGS